ncbi:hypothetical protein LAZ67_21000222 [Cordylochernes scorpioides]|uniref:C2H2-type domain-containing protein n=1 Tax=Cordylochernes scorpioides TaxID=51811 RepID=A0ABY6LNJ6_9ARAC|nr:hypothetical protein LAZ67_21000222 [Cordylochernes scorpioides]
MPHVSSNHGTCSGAIFPRGSKPFIKFDVLLGNRRFPVCDPQTWLLCAENGAEKPDGYERVEEASPSDTSEEGEAEEEDGSDSEGEATCNVCEKTYRSARLLGQHQLRRRHFGCSVCDGVFETMAALESHKESLEHWSEDDARTRDSSSSCEGELRMEELERLL